MAVHYRLPKEEEINQYSINDDQNFSESGIRLVKFQLPSKYSQLADYLWSGEWKTADEETVKVMLQVAGRERERYLDVRDIENFPCSDLHIIDQLWVYASKGHFGFSVQKKIYQSLGGTREYNEKIWYAFCDSVGWKNKWKWRIPSDLPLGHFPRPDRGRKYLLSHRMDL
nr:GUN4 domain-containing protein [Scytonema sp. UIC 10036]